MTASIPNPGAFVDVVAVQEPTPYVLNPQGDRTGKISAAQTVPEVSPRRVRSWHVAGDGEVTNEDGGESCDHQVGGWEYLIDAKRPRAYGKCVRCARLLLALLPARLSTPWRHTMLATSPEEFHALEHFAEAAEDVFRESGTSQSLTFGDGVVLARVLPYIIQRVENEAQARADQLVHSALRSVERYSSEAVELLERRDQAERKLRSAKRRLSKTVASLLAAEANPGRVILAAEGLSVAYVYALVSTAEPDRWRYVGSTDNPSARLAAHLGKGANRLVRDWVKSIASSTHRVEMIQLWSGTCRSEAYGQEVGFIGLGRSKEMADLNEQIPQVMS